MVIPQNCYKLGVFSVYLFFRIFNKLVCFFDLTLCFYVKHLHNPKVKK